ncbi:MAG TPA: cyclic nucleotide-binding domain-containing protein [Thermoleophilaceae bacterium]|jgi:CRP-like cAMP-binding protein|nr:cyclic nucleotide-binding domain-containing protein [Thermoleophilaceae bacterium]
MRLFSHDTKVDALSRAPLFEGLTDKELAEVAKRSEDMDFPAGKVLCREGELGSEFYVIMEGEAEVTRHGRNVATQGSGSFFGEISLVEDVPRNATVTAATPVRCFVLTRGRFLHVLDEYPGVERKVMRALAKRLVAASDDPSL